MLLRNWITIALFAALLGMPGGAADADALFEAARQGDLEKVRTLLEAGLDVNTPSPYGATALFYACDKGHLEVVRYLLEKGAEINLTDDFYGFSPLGWSLQNGHKPIALLLLERGAEDASMALSFGVRSRDLELVRAALATGKVEARAFRQSLKQAERIKADTVLEVLRGVDPDSLLTPKIDISPQQMASYAGAYREQEGKRSLEVELKEGVLTANLQGEEQAQSWRLKPVGENEFQSQQDEDVSLTFVGRSGTTERVFLTRGQQTLHLPRLDDDAGDEPLPETQESGSSKPAVRTDPQNWPGFRGPNASGIADGQGAPLSWDAVETPSRNILWKTPIPGLGNSSPVIWGDQVFVTTAVSSNGNRYFRTGLYGDVVPVTDESEHVWKIYALDRRSGKILWDQEAGQQTPDIQRHPKSTHANPTPTTDGSHVVALFPDLGLFCYDLQGKLLWKTDLGRLDSGWFYDRSYQWGFASSPILYRDTVIVQADIQDQSFIAAYSLEDGRQVWKTLRDSISAWATPSLYTGGERDELIANAPRIQSYDPASGKELWSLGPSSEVVVATPVVGEELIYLTAGYPPVRPIYAVRPGASGDISLKEGEKSNASVAWCYDRGGTYMPTPILYRGLLYTNANDGRLTCYEARTGRRIYRARIGGTGGSFVASPLAADGRIYFTAEDGKSVVIQAGSRYQELSVNPLGETVLATPAISDGVMVIRGLEHVYGIAER